LAGSIGEVDNDYLLIGIAVRSWQGDGNGRCSVLRVGTAHWSRRREGTSGAGHAQEGFALFTEAWNRQTGGTPRFIIQEDGADDCLHIAAHAGSVIIEGLDNSIKIGRAGMTGNQSLN